MKLSAKDASFSLTILGYQYPDAAGEPYDANWLSIYVEAEGPDGVWTGTDACLLTYEAARLADWLAALAHGEAVPTAISFLEPALLFRLVNGARGKTLRVHFGNLVNPSWRYSEAGLDRAGASPDLWLDFPLTEADIAGAAGDLRQQQRRYPNRAEQ
jgi:hypothetical protein